MTYSDAFVLSEKCARNVLYYTMPEKLTIFINPLGKLSNELNYVIKLKVGLPICYQLSYRAIKS